MAIKYKKEWIEETEQELLDMSREEASYKLREKERRFCENYITNLNIKMAAIKAGFNPKTAHIAGYKLRQHPKINRYIAWLKLRVSNDCHITAMDIVDKYTKIAFSDITDFVTMKNNKLYLTDSENIDGQLVKSVKQGRDGIQVELHDKMRALEKLEQFFDVMPSTWKQKVEERKLELMEQKLELEKEKMGLFDSGIEDDGFIDALRSSATEVWEEDLNE